MYFFWPWDTSVEISVSDHETDQIMIMRHEINVEVPLKELTGLSRGLFWLALFARYQI